MYVLKSAEMREADRYTIEDLGIPGIVLMENAGINAVRSLNDAFPPDSSRIIRIICGKGNNGGDGFVIARHLFLDGDEVSIFLLGKKSELKGDARTNMRITDRLGIPIHEIKDFETWEEKTTGRSQPEIIVDAILGIGITKPAEGLFKQVIMDINRTEAFVLAVDIPSGLSADEGELIGEAVIADLTVTFAFPKIAHILPPAEFYCGEIIIADISIPPEAVSFEKGSREILTADSVSEILKPRPVDSHKGDFGHLLVIAGSMGKLGAATMTARSATLSGAGLVTLAAPSSCVPVLQTTLIQEMAYPLKDDGKGVFTIDDLKEILDAADGKTAIAIGPGIGQEKETKSLLIKLLAKLTIPVVLDADGLNLLAGKTEILSELPTNHLILTPHPGEFSRLTGISVNDIQKNRLELTEEFARKWNQIVILKGYRTVIASANGSVFISSTGNPGMASGGSGDVLTGILGGLLAMKITTIDAARLGVYVHGMAGDMAKEKFGEISLNAADIMSHLPETFKYLSE